MPVIYRLFGWIQALDEFHLGLDGVQFDADCIMEVKEDGTVTVTELESHSGRKIAGTRKTKYLGLGRELAAAARGVKQILIEDDEVVLAYEKQLSAGQLGPTFLRAAGTLAEFLEVTFTDIVPPDKVKGDFALRFQELRQARAAVLESWSEGQ
jgi:hypothetical protein